MRLAQLEPKDIIAATDLCGSGWSEGRGAVTHRLRLQVSFYIFDIWSQTCKNVRGILGSRKTMQQNRKDSNFLWKENAVVLHCNLAPHVRAGRLLTLWKKVISTDGGRSRCDCSKSPGIVKAWKASCCFWTFCFNFDAQKLILQKWKRVRLHLSKHKK